MTGDANAWKKEWRKSNIYEAKDLTFSVEVFLLSQDQEACGYLI